jgi:ribosomal protein S18 acetylase RimI-like enzyme
MVRMGAPDDIPALKAIEKRARSVYAALAGFEFAGASPPIAADRLISGTTFVAEISALLVGFALVKPMDGALYLANISVLPDASNRGVGTRLLERVIAHAVLRRRRPSRSRPFVLHHGSGLGFVGRALRPCLRAKSVPGSGPS